MSFGRHSELAVAIAMGVLAGCRSDDLGVSIPSKPGQDGAGAVLEGIAIQMASPTARCELAWAAPVEHLAYGRRLVPVLSSDGELDPAKGTVLVAGSREAPGQEHTGVLSEFSIASGAMVRLYDVKPLDEALGQSPRTDTFGRYSAGWASADGATTQVFTGDFCRGGRYQGVVGLFASSDGRTWNCWANMGEEKSMLGIGIAIGRAPSLDGGWRLWAGGRGFAGDHTSQIGRVNAYQIWSGEPDYTLTGGEGFGTPLLALGDIDGDDDADLLIAGERKWERERYVAISGRSGAVLWEVTQDDAFFCVELALGGDLDGDGLRDILVGQARGRTGRVLALSARDGHQLRTFEPPDGEELFGIGLGFATNNPAAIDGVMAVGYASPRDGRTDARSGVVLLAANGGEILGRLELRDRLRELAGRDALLIPQPDGRSYALLLSMEWIRPAADRTDYVLRYDLRP